MDEETNTGVPTGESASPAAGDSGSPVVPQTTSVEADSNAEFTDQSAAPPAAGDEIPENDDDLASLPETERNPLINQRNRIRELNKWRTGAEPVTTWVEERGFDNVKADAQMVGQLFSADLEQRQQGYAAFRSQDPVAFDRLITDVIDTPWVQERFLRSIDPQTLLTYVQDAGLLPEGTEVDPSTTIPPEFQAVWPTLPAAVRADYAKMTPELRNWNLRREAQIHSSQQAEARRVQEQRTQQAYEQKSKVYNDVRSIIQTALTEKIPGSEEATRFVLHATETALYQSPEGAALWNELDAHIENGENRAVREKLPLLIAKAKAIATTQAQWLNERESKARQFDELMAKVSQDEILAYVAKVRGGQRQPGPGTPPAPVNGNIPKPELRGQYDPVNIASYGIRS